MFQTVKIMHTYSYFKANNVSFSFSSKFRSLVESETLEFSVRCHYPLRWNDHQEWLLNLTGCKASGWFVYAHKDFFEGIFVFTDSRILTKVF